MGADSLALYPGMVAESAGVVLAPPGGRGLPPGIDPAIAALRAVRELGLPFLATGESHGLVFIEAARSLLEIEHAHSAAIDPTTSAPVVLPLPAADGDEARHRIELEITVADTVLSSRFDAEERVIEFTDIQSGLNPDYAQRVTDAGFRPVGCDRHGGRPYLHVLDGHPYHVTAAFLPQLRTAADAPHPLFQGLVAACMNAR